MPLVAPITRIVVIEEVILVMKGEVFVVAVMGL